ncbi:hypothetical protein HanIR_Chr15g0767451 [Helianthus annuus]|nr:hypothetical protein HanIR_Chr15g0767451 [Helianthus annuus]
MRVLTRGCVVEGHVDLVTSAQRWSSEQRWWRWEETVAVEEREGPSRRGRMWVWMMSEGRVVRVVVVVVMVKKTGQWCGFFGVGEWGICRFLSGE